MSRSAPTAVNPASRFFEFSAKKGEVRYFDKANGENIVVPTPFKFLYLDSVYQAGGGKKIGKKPHQEFVGYYSNAVRVLKTDKLTVRSRDGVVTEGLYEEVKKESGVKLIVGVYLAYYGDDKKLQIGYLKLKGSSMGEWWDFCKRNKIEEGAITLTRGEEQTDEQDNIYYLPKFDYSSKVSDEANAAAIELDRHLQEYLKGYFNQQEEVKVQAASAGGSDFYENEPEMNFEEKDDFEPEQDDDIPF